MTYGNYREEVVVLADIWHGKLKEVANVTEAQAPVWKPKNKGCVDLYLKCWKEHQQELQATGRRLSSADREDPGSAFWENESVPFFDTPEEVVTHVNTDGWREFSRKIQQAGSPGWERRLELSLQVLEQLEEGVSSGVRGPGLLPIQMKNFFED